MTLTLAHLSDVHLPLEARLTPRHWRVKRMLGAVNWQRNRRAVHRADVIEMLLADMAAQCPDHIAVTGDLVNIGLPDEHATALAWLQRLGPPELVSVVPGNHDIYVRSRRDPGVARWADYMASDAWGRELTRAWTGWPYVRRLGPAALIGLNSAVPTAPFIAAGRLGPEQLARLPGLLDRIRADGLVRLVLVHHPPLPGQAARLRGLEDAVKLKRVLATHGAELLLHGHNHRNMQRSVTWHGGTALAVGVPSFSAGVSSGAEPLARYNLIRLHPGKGTTRIELFGRGLAAPGGPVVEIERRWLDFALPAAA